MRMNYGKHLSIFELDYSNIISDIPMGRYPYRFVSNEKCEFVRSCVCLFVAATTTDGKMEVVLLCRIVVSVVSVQTVTRDGSTVTSNRMTVQWWSY